MRSGSLAVQAITLPVVLGLTALVPVLPFVAYCAVWGVEVPTSPAYWVYEAVTSPSPSFVCPL